jgi:hypothetical protein
MNNKFIENREKQPVQSIRRGTGVMYCLKEIQYLCDFQTNMFKRWQQNGNIF